MPRKDLLETLHQHAPSMPMSLRTIIPTSAIESENDSPLKQPPIDLRRISSIDDMPAEIKE